MYETQEMRTVMAGLLREAMSADPKVVIMDADLARAHGTLPLYDEFPNQAFDAGIAEGNMVCVAAGLASYGFKPFAFTFTPFMARRACDQAALSVSYAGQNVKLVGTDPGICAEINGGTHMSIH